MKKVLGAGTCVDAETRACIVQGTDSDALEDMIKAMGYEDGIRVK